MKVVMVGPFGLQRKGTMRARAVPIAKALAARGHHVTVLLPPWDCPGDSGLACEEDGVHIQNVGLPARLPLVFHLLLTARLVRTTIGLQPDVVHCFKPKAYSGLTHFVLHWLRRLGAAPRRLRLVVDEDDWERAWNQIEPYSPLQKVLFAWQERWCLRHADMVIAASRELVSLVGQEGVAAERIVYVPNGVWPGAIDLAAARPEAVRMLWELEDAPVVLLYSRFLEFRLERVVRILQLLVAREPRVKLLIVGEGLRTEEAELDDMLADAGLSDHAAFTGWGRSEQLTGYFAATDVAVFPFDDTPINRCKCSAKLVELLAAGLPVVADAVGQNKEYIVDGETGFLVGPGDDVALANATLRLLADKALSDRLGHAAARRVHEHFAWTEMALRVEGAYGQMP